MSQRTREMLTVIALACVVIVLFSRQRNMLSLAGLPFANETAPTELIVWSGESPVGETWASLGNGGRIEYPSRSGVDGKGKALTAYLGTENSSGWGLNWKGWYPVNACDDVSKYASLVFYIRQEGTVAKLDLAVSLTDNEKRSDSAAASNQLHVIGDGGVQVIDKSWRKVVMPLHRFAQNKPLRLERIWGIDFACSGAAQAVIQIDRIGFSMEASPSTVFPEQPRYKAFARVDLAKRGHQINDGIYGVCNLPDHLLREYGIPLTRWGGNTSTRYNWKINADNGASDWYFKNRGTPIRNITESAYFQNLRQAQARGGSAYQTLPMIGWVAKDVQSYGFSVKKYGAQSQSEPRHPDVGDGKLPDGSLIRSNDPSDTSIAVGPAFVAEAVALAADLSSKEFPNYWALDNEPMIWHQTHRDIRPEPLGYDELWDRTVLYGEAIKKADPNAKVAGFCSWGWTDLFYSAKDEGKDRYATRPDFHAHGREGLAEWFIHQCGDYKRKNGRALIDVFDLHWYPQCDWRGQTPYTGKGMDVSLNELRLRSTRDLWDASYVQESWIKQTADRQPTRVIRRVREWIDKHNPGMEICLGEYNFGGADNITGGLAQADVFGILASEKVDLAFIWNTPEGSQNLAWKLFRNYDNCGGRFGNESLIASSTHPDLSIYAARRADGALTIVAINKNLGGSCELKLDAARLAGNMRIWNFNQKSCRITEITSEPVCINGQIQLDLPAASASMIVVK